MDVDEKCKCKCKCKCCRKEEKKVVEGIPRGWLGLAGPGWAWLSLVGGREGWLEGSQRKKKRV